MKKTFLILLIALLPCAVQAQLYDSETVRETIDGRARTVYIYTYEVTPQLPAEPALRYKLTWGFDQRTATNAAPKYNYAMRELAEYRYRTLNRLAQRQQENFDKALTDPETFAEKKAALEAFEKELAELPATAAAKLRNEKLPGYQASEYERYCSVPRDQFPMEKAKEFVTGFQEAYRLLEEGSRCDYCDWGHHIRGNDNPIAILLPEVQGARELARALQVKARYEIYTGDYDAAVKTIRVGKILAKHVAEEPILVSVLVGIAIDGMMNSVLGELMRQPDAPNLYWTISAQPEFAGAIGRAVEMEMDMLRAMVPGLAKAMDDPDSLSDADWKRLNDWLCKTMADFLPMISVLSSMVMLQEDSSVSHPLETALRLSSLVAYPRARQWLIEQGKTPEEVEAMHTTKVIGLWSVERYKVIRDGMLKIVFIPPSQLKMLLEEWDNTMKDFSINFRAATPLDMLVNLMYPAVQAAFNAETRCIMNNDVLRIIEAIRIYAAQNDGKLPVKLDDIASVPIPQIEPTSGKPYDYKIKDNTAVIEVNMGYMVQRFVVKVRSQ